MLSPSIKILFTSLIIYCRLSSSVTAQLPIYKTGQKNDEYARRTLIQELARIFKPRKKDALMK